MAAKQKGRLGRIAVIVLTFALAVGTIWWYLNVEPEKKKLKQEAVPEIIMGQIILYNKGNDVIMGSDHPSYKRFKPLIEEAIYVADEVAFGGSLIAEGDVIDQIQAQKLIRDTTDTIPSINAVKIAIPSVGSFLMEEKDLRNKHGLKMRGDQVVVTVGSSLPGVLLIRNSFEEQQWQAYRVPKSVLLKFIEEAREK